MFKVLRGGAGTSPMFEVTEGARNVSHVQGDGGGEERQPCTGGPEGGGAGASAMYKVMGGGEGRKSCSR